MKTLWLRVQRMVMALVLVLALGAGVPHALHAQTTTLSSPEPVVSPHRWGINLSAGMIGTTFTSDADLFGQAGAGLTAGLQLSYRLLPWLAVQPEAHLAVRRGKEDLDAWFTGAGQADLTLGYLDVPLLVKTYLPGDVAGTMPYLGAGPYLGTRLFTRVDDPNFVVEAEDLDETLQTRDYGLMLGFGLEHEAAQAGPVRRVLFDARYAWGLADLMEEAGGPALHTRGFRIAVGIGW
ncbi:hypothetical protein AWN76_014160 [Rhodothermaceae bacterium RA]|nr:hypothetical protein AWN76_014160 [Rhodothermaceae bacterium RA]